MEAIMQTMKAAVFKGPGKIVLDGMAPARPRYPE
jgi:hypothetical protein